MCELLLILKSGAAEREVMLSEFKSHGTGHYGNTDGWGILLRHTAATSFSAGTMASDNDPTWPNIETLNGGQLTVFAHLREASEGQVSINNCQPFLSDMRGITVGFAHNGECEGVSDSARLRNTTRRPAGSTDSELAYLILLDALDDTNLNSHDDVLGVLREFSDFLVGYGPTNLVVMIGEFTFLLANVRKPVGKDVLQEPGLYMQADKEIVAFASEPLTDDFVPLQSGDWFFYSTDRLLAQGRMNISTHNSAVQGV